MRLVKLYGKISEAEPGDKEGEIISDKKKVYINSDPVDQHQQASCHVTSAR